MSLTKRCIFNVFVLAVHIHIIQKVLKFYIFRIYICLYIIDIHIYKMNRNNIQLSCKLNSLCMKMKIKDRVLRFTRNPFC